jgi:hypothetical protein
MTELILLLHAAATLVMVGVIWFVQIVHLAVNFPCASKTTRTPCERF